MHWMNSTPLLTFLTRATAETGERRKRSYRKKTNAAARSRSRSSRRRTLHLHRRVRKWSHCSTFLASIHSIAPNILAESNIRNIRWFPLYHQLTNSKICNSNHFVIMCANRKKTVSKTNGKTYWIEQVSTSPWLALLPPLVASLSDCELRAYEFVTNESIVDAVFFCVSFGVWSFKWVAWRCMENFCYEKMCILRTLWIFVRKNYWFSLNWKMCIELSPSVAFIRFKICY